MLEVECHEKLLLFKKKKSLLAHRCHGEKPNGLGWRKRQKAAVRRVLSCSTLVAERGGQ